MTTELWMLLGTVILFFAVNLVQFLLALPGLGIKGALGNREEEPFPLSGMAGRAQRTVRNHVEGLVMFAPLVLIAAQIGVSNSHTVLGAQVYFATRIAHAVFYILGVKGLRSVAFIIGDLALLGFVIGAFMHAG